MSKKYYINEFCRINEENPTPSKEYMDIALNIEPINKSDKFENFVLAIENHQRCCEWWGCVNTITYPNEELFVESIEVDISLKDDEIEDIYKINSNMFEPEDYNEPYSELDYFAVRVNIRDRKPIYGIVFNSHNGYYSHQIYYSNEELKIDIYDIDGL